MKIDIITSCHDCSHRFYHNNELRCDFNNKDINHPNSWEEFIPVWCQLPDAPNVTKSALQGDEYPTHKPTSKI